MNKLARSTLIAMFVLGALYKSRQSRGSIYQGHFQFGHQEIEDPEPTVVRVPPTSAPVAEAMDAAMAHMMNHALQHDEFLCFLCGEQINYEPNAPRHQMSMRIGSSEPSFQPFVAVFFVHLKCARHLAQHLRDNQAIWSMEAPEQ